MARRAAYIDSTRALYPNLLLVDGGNMFESMEWFQLERGMFLVRMMHQLGYHVVGVGEKDLAWGVRLYKDSTAAYGLLPVSANIADRTTHKLLFQPFAIEDVHGVKVGIFSVLSPANGFQISPHATQRDSVECLDVAAAVRRTVAALRPKCQVVVGLLNLGNHAADSLAGQVPGLDVAIVGGQVPQMLPRGTMSGSALVVSAGSRGQYVARTLISLDQGKVASAAAEVVPLDNRFPEPDGIANQRKDFEDGLSDRIRKRQQDQDAAEAHRRGADHYLGREACVDCHRAAYESWSNSAHARAFDTLTKRRKDLVSDCVSCHVTGYRENGGYFSSQQPGGEVNGQLRQMEGVQCEACHGMGTRHDTMDPAFASAAKASCVRCHNKEQDPKFDYATAWAKIAH
ncbi:MAG TPA: multiheme c-type cytochrome [Candidatus Saccharimonadales bacterium]|nr:multiheme c-type cytochrome [Candidatus Saccharimonadales bacterium]